MNPIFLLFFAISCSFAIPFYGNQSHVQWKSVESDHFRVHYPAEYQGQAGVVVSLAEAVHDSVTRRYRVRLPGKVNLVVRNSLFSNGLANPIHNAMNIWLTDWDFKVRTTHSWMTDVVTHEFSHLVSIQSGSKLPPWIHGLQVSYQDFYNEQVRSDWIGVYPFTVYPLWFAEGTSQYESARLGFDAWDTHRDMLLRVAAIEDKILPLSKMADFAPHGLESELGPYNQGFSMVRYLAEKYGDGVIPNLWSELSRIHRVTFSAALEQVIGLDEKALYAQWKSDQIAKYQEVKDSLGLLVTGVKRSKDAFWQDFPQWVNGELVGVSNMGSPWFEGAMFRVPKDSLPDSLGKDSSRALAMSSFQDKRFTLVKPWLEKGFSVRHIPGKGSRIVYVTYQKRDRNGKAYFDIAVDDSSASPFWGERPSMHLATEYADAVYPDLSPNGSEIAFVRREQNGSRFVLSRVQVPDSTGQKQEIVDLMIPSADALSFTFYTPRWSPDGQYIAFSFFDGEHRQVGVVDRDGSTFQLVASGDFDARDPAWTPDGKSLVISCNHNGIFNLWRYALDSTVAPVPLTNVLGGAFTPVFGDSSLFYTGYDVDGFSLYELSLLDTIKSPLYSVKPSVNRVKEPLVHQELQGVQQTYKAIPVLPVLVPLISIEEHSDEINRGILSGKAVWKAGFAMGLSDPLQKNQIELAVLLEMGKGVSWINTQGLNPALHSDLMASLENRSFPWTWSVSYLRRNMASQDTVRYEDPRSYEDSLGISSMAVAMSVLQGSAGYSVFKKGDSVITSVQSQWARFDLYQDGFAWDYLKRKQWNLLLTWLPDQSDEAGSGVEGSGRGMYIGSSLSRSELFRPGTFRESFTVSAQGAIIPIYRTFDVQEIFASTWWSFANPIHPGANLALGSRLSAIMAWQGRSTATDTLDHFFHHSLDLHGYPALADAENSAMHGERTMMLQAHYVFPIVSDLDVSWWIASLKSAYVDVFAQMGSAWWNGLSWKDQLLERQNWKRSVGLEMRLSTTLFRQTPLEISLNLARSLDPLMSNGQEKSVPTVQWNWLPNIIEPTTVAFSAGFQFGNVWQGARPYMKSGVLQ